jgi:23S rRNA G2069 N7-methylase RlmK/C1962 C5-methylase RlmI
MSCPGKLAVLMWTLSLLTTSKSFLHSPQRASLRVLRSSALSSDAAPSTSSKSSKKKNKPHRLEVPSVILKRTKQSRAFRDGNQLVFTRAVDRIEGTVKSADLVKVQVEEQNKDAQAAVLGWGVYNPDSLYKVRILCSTFVNPVLHKRILKCPSAQEAMREILLHHFQVALQTRRVLNLPSASYTDTYRLVHGEGDCLSGLAVDMIDSTAVVMSSAGWCQVHRDVITETLLGVLPDGTNLVWKTTANRLQQDGYDLKQEEGTRESSDDDSVEDQMVPSLENGIKYRTYPYTPGQKTGIYSDQRDNRKMVAEYCQGKRVLDLCCYHGGFSLNAVVNGGAASVTGVDSSADAIEASRANAELNGCADGQVEFVQSDISNFLQESFGQREYDVVVLDPPKLAPSVATLDKARRKYHSFNRDALKLISGDGGLILTCTCSAAMTQKDGGQYFLSMVHQAALSAGRQVTLVKKAGAASCHTQSPISWPAGDYLTAALFYVHPIVE